MIYEQIQERRLKDLPEIDLKEWAIEEVENLANDFGNKLDNESILHIARRLTGVFKTKYRSWFVGDVHAAFQTGLSGAYGSFHKVTVKALFYFLKKTEQQLINKHVVNAEEESDRKSANFNAPPDECTNFLTWATKNLICLKYLNPTWEPLIERDVSPEVKALTDEYQQAIEMGMLEPFKRRLKTEMNDYNEQH